MGIAGPKVAPGLDVDGTRRGKLEAYVVAFPVPEGEARLGSRGKLVDEAEGRNVHEVGRVLEEGSLFHEEDRPFFRARGARGKVIDVGPDDLHEGEIALEPGSGAGSVFVAFPGQVDGLFLPDGRTRAR